MTKKVPKKIVVTIDATHSGIVNGNYFMYLPDGMKMGEESFTKPYNKPVTDGHPKFYENEKETPVIGRIIGAKYESYGLNDTMDRLNPKSENIVDAVQETYRMQLKDKSFKGLGHMQVQAEITDPESIKQVVDKRKLTVSIGAYLDNARCSVCGSKWGQCEHEIGGSYDGLSAFRVGGRMKFDHLAFVKTPADENAMVSSVEITDNNDGSFNIMVYDEVQIMEFTEVKTLKEVFIDSFNAMMAGSESRVLKKELADSYAEASAKGRQHSYLFTDTKEVYLKNPLGLAISKLVIDEIEETEVNKEELTALRNVIDTLIESGKILPLKAEDETFQDIFDKMTEEVVAKEPEAAEHNNTATIGTLDQSTIDSIADAVYNKIKQDAIKTDSYTKGRVKTLELALIELEDKLDQSDKEILAFAHKFDKDIQDAESAREFFMKMEDTTEPEVELEKLKINDNIIQAEDQTGNEQSESTEVVDEFDLRAVGDTYRDILRGKGFRDAKAYMKGLKDSKKIPENFIL